MSRDHGEGDVEIIFEDDRLVVVVKPPGMPTANAPVGRPSLHGWLKNRLGAEAFVGIVSRLDAPVSGLVVAAKTPAAAAALAAQFRDRTVHKAYAAVVAGRFPAPLGDWIEWRDRIVRGDGREPSRLEEGRGEPGRGGDDRRTVGRRPAAEPQEAVTRARVVRRAGEVSLVELEPATGRRHQLRVQLSSRGCPIVGDRLYRARLPFPEGIALHARSLDFTHPTTGHAIRLEAAVPASWRERFPALLRGR